MTQLVSGSAPRVRAPLLCSRLLVWRVNRNRRLCYVWYSESSIQRKHSFLLLFTGWLSYGTGLCKGTGVSFAHHYSPNAENSAWPKIEAQKLCVGMSEWVNEYGSYSEVFRRAEGGGGQNRARAIPSERILQNWCISQFYRNTIHIKVQESDKKASLEAEWNTQLQLQRSAPDESGRKVAEGCFGYVHTCSPTNASLPCL